MATNAPTLSNVLAAEWSRRIVRVVLEDAAQVVETGSSDMWFDLITRANIPTASEETKRLAVNMIRGIANK